jgi:hypothetical protein
MGKLALTLQHAAALAQPGGNAGWQTADDKPLGSWVFEAIYLQHQNADPMLPHRVVVGIESELLGFVVEERAFWSPGQTVRARKFFTRTEADAVIEAGRIAHDWLCQGYAVFSGGEESSAT